MFSLRGLSAKAITILMDEDKWKRKQENTTSLTQKKVQEIALGSARTRITQGSMDTIRSPANCRPSTGYAKYIPHDHCKVWLKYYCEVPLFQPEQDDNGHSVQLSWTSMGIIYCIAKKVPIEFGDMMHM